MTSRVEWNVPPPTSVAGSPLRMRATETRLTRRSASTVAAAAAVGAAVALATSFHFNGQTGVSKTGLLLPVFIAVAVALACLAFVRFEALVLCLLLIRDGVDSTKTGAAIGPTVVLSAGFILAAVFWILAQRSAHEPDARRAPISRAGAIFAAASLVSVVTSEQPRTSLLEWARLVSVVMMLAVLERLFTAAPRSVPRALVAVYFSLLVPAAFGLYQWVTHRHLSYADGIPRIHGTFANPNSFAMYLAFLVVMGVALMPAVSGRWRWGLFGAVVLATGCLYLTQTRGSWIGAALGVLLVVRLRSKRLALVALVVLAVVAVLPPVTSRFSDLSHSQRASGVPGNSLVWRVEHWSEALHLSKGRPVTGIGLKMVEVESPDAKLPHNDYIRAYVEGGGLGLVAYLGLLVSFIVVARRAIRRTRVGLPRGIAVGFAGCTLAFLAISLSDNLMTQSVVLWYFAVFAAAASAVAHGRQTEAQATELELVNHVGQ